MQVNIDKARHNPAVSKLLNKHYKQLHSMLVKSEADEDVFNDTYLKITYKYNPEKDFVEQFKWLFNQLKGAYYRDDRANHFYQIREDLISIPDYIPDTEQEEDLSIVNRLKAQICRT